MTLAEGATLLALVLVAVPLKHFAGFPQGTQLLGPLHGLVFLAFCWTVVQSWSEGIIERSDAFRLLIGAVIPLGGIVNESWLKRRLAG